MGILDELKSEYKFGGIVQRLIFWNVGLFVIPMIIFSILKLSGIYLPEFDWTLGSTQNWFALSSEFTDLWKMWTLITYAFLHHDFFHLLFNMLMLFFAGRVFLTFFTQKQLFGVYIQSAIIAGLMFIIGYSTIPALTNVSAAMVGASASIMAILVAAATCAPQYSVRLMLIGTVKLWHIALGLVVIDLIYISAENTGGHIAHLAGALYGFIYIKLLQNGTDMTKSIVGFQTFVENLFKPKKKTPFKAVHRNPATTARTTVKKEKDITQKQIDDILDKISKSGYDSLTKAEKDFLFRAGK
ncbi:rhomboid family intramembrane serine protease [Flavobacterium sp. J372]|uniref:rhomboid family intramembrane serine protease n=1 Tax=Flavobacterium sp. J372 TaxID=2898436 RepID=UPI0021511511|nr:rhomboid family intramembrane serine protease [Flavobacterium sp. J372]MCR5863203.1 rhomboid family intramembrane serine protease [Flavobacterium sp. J372]